MGKIPVNKLLNSTKNVGIFIKENKEVIQTIGNSIPILKDISEKTIQSLKSANSPKKTKLEKTPYRKQRYTEYLTNIMPKAHSYTYIELIMKKKRSKKLYRTNHS